MPTAVRPSLFLPPLVVSAQGGDLAGRVQRLGIAVVCSCCDVGRLRHADRASILGVIGQYRAAGGVDHIQRCGNDLMLERRFIRLAQGVSEIERHPQGAGRFDALGVFPHQRNGYSGQAGRLEHAGQHAHGVRAQRSSGSQEHEVDALILEALRYFGSRFLRDDGAVAQRAHEGVVVGSQCANGALVNQLPHAIDGVGDIDVPIDCRTVKSDAEVALYDVRRCRSRWAGPDRWTRRRDGRG